MNTALIQRNLWKKLQSKKYRHSFVASQIGAGIAAQIASTRMGRGWTQRELADRANMSQVRISVLEDPSYENFSIKTLRRIAEAFDTALIIKFAPFSEMLNWLTTSTPGQLTVRQFTEDSLPIMEPVAIDTAIKRASEITDLQSQTAAASASGAAGSLLPSFKPQVMDPWFPMQIPQRQASGRLS